MKTLRTLRIVPAVVTAVALVVAALSAASPALAGKIADVSSTTVKLAAPANAPEPRASGQYTLYRDVASGIEQGTVSCKNLTPGRQYTVVVLVHWSQWVRMGYDPYPIGSGSYFMELAARADARGRLNAQFTVVSDWSPSGGVNRSVQDLWIENEEGSVVLQ